jgi:hypothetical protein
VGEKMFKRIIKISEEIESVKKNITEREKRIGFLSVIPVTDDPLSMRWITLRNQLRILTSCKRGEYVYETDDGGLILISNLKIVKMAKEDN